MTLPIPSVAPARQRQIELGVIALAFVPLLLSAWDEIQLVDPTQYAEVARRIVATGDWTHLHDFSGPYFDKPPITFWLIALSLKLLGQTSFAVKLPSLLLSVVLAVLTYRIGAELWDPRTGRLAALLLTASVSFQLMVVDPKIDMVVTTFMTGAVLGVVLARRRPGAIHGAWVCAALGVLTKGPIGLVAPTLAVIPEALRRRWGQPDQDRGFLSRLLPFRPVTGPLVFLALVGPWLWVSQSQFGSAGPEFLLWKQSFGRLFERTYRNDTSPVFFMHTALWAFLPFTPVLLFELGRRLVAWRRSGFRLPPDETRLALWWLLLPFVGISASSYKLPQYLYWLSPPAALLSARALTSLSSTFGEKILSILARLSLGLGIGGIVLVTGLVQFAFPPSLASRLFWIATMAGTVALGAFASRSLAKDSRVAVLCATSALGFHLFFSGSLHRALLEYQPDGRFGTMARQVDPGGVVLPFVDAAATNAAGFYAQRDVAALSVPQLVATIRAGRAKVAVATEAVLPQLEAAGLRATTLLELPVFPTSRPSGKFLQERTRPGTLHYLRLVELAPSTPNEDPHSSG